MDNINEIHMVTFHRHESTQTIQAEELSYFLMQKWEAINVVITPYKKVQKDGSRIDG